MPRWPVRIRITPLRLFLVLIIVFWLLIAAGAFAEVRPFDAGGALLGAVCLSASFTLVWWIVYSPRT